jgi:hypothetical protein
MECVSACFAPFLFPCGQLEGVVWSLHNLDGVDEEACHAEVSELIQTLLTFGIDFTVTRNRF